MKAVEVLSKHRQDFVLDLIGDGADKLFFEEYVKNPQSIPHDHHYYRVNNLSPEFA